MVGGPKHRDAERTDHVARADGPRGDAVDTRVKEIEADMGAREIIPRTSSQAMAFSSSVSVTT